MWQRFTERARQVVFYAQEEAGKWGENFVGPEHLLLGLVRVPENAGAVILERLGVSLEAMREGVQERLHPGEGTPGRDMLLTPAAKKAVDFAFEEARALKHNYIGGEHLLLGLLRQEKGLASEVLAALGVTLEAAREQLRQIQDGQTAPDEELLTLDEAVRFLGTSKPTLYRLLGQEEIKGLKVGRQWRFRRADLTAYMERGPVAVAAAPREDLDMELAFFAGQLSETAEPEEGGDPEAKTIRLAHQIMKLAIVAKASDIHLEPSNEDFRLRLRVDGVLQETRRLPSSVRESLTTRFKMMAEMDIAEKRLPQDGRIPVRHEGKDFDFRVAAVPSLYGEALTLRILLKQDILLGLDKLGLTPEDQQQIRDLMGQPNGIVVATGPTGSGKTTLLYSCLHEVADAERKTVTVEDPIEFALPYTTQTQVHKKAGLTFASLLRALLRQDPDILLLGEMRDLETAQIAVESALTGHLLLTTLSTGDAPSALRRLLDMSLEPYLVSATVKGIVAARLARRVCDHCKQPVDLAGEPLGSRILQGGYDSISPALKVTAFSHIIRLAREGGYEVPAEAVFVRGAGCDQCRGRGYWGRVGLYEVLTLTGPLTEAVLRRAPVEELTALAVAGGMRTLLADGLRKAVAGQTTVEEALRVVSVTG